MIQTVTLRKPAIFIDKTSANEYKSSDLIWFFLTFYVE